MSEVMPALCRGGLRIECFCTNGETMQIININITFSRVFASILARCRLVSGLQWPIFVSLVELNCQNAEPRLVSFRIGLYEIVRFISGARLSLFHSGRN